MNPAPANDDLAGATQAGKAAAAAMGLHFAQVSDIFRQALTTASYRAGNIEPDPVIRARIAARTSLDELAKADSPDGARRYAGLISPLLGLCFATVAFGAPVAVMLQVPG